MTYAIPAILLVLALGLLHMANHPRMFVAVWMVAGVHLLIAAGLVVLYFLFLLFGLA